jgi:hypothetical protein
MVPDGDGTDSDPGGAAVGLGEKLTQTNGDLPAWIQAVVAALIACGGAIVGAVGASWRMAERFAAGRTYVDAQTQETRHVLRADMQREAAANETAQQKLEERVRKNENDIAILKDRRGRQ